MSTSSIQCMHRFVVFGLMGLGLMACTHGKSDSSPRSSTELTEDGGKGEPNLTIDASVDTDDCRSVQCGPYGQCIMGECVCDKGFVREDERCVDLDECQVQLDSCVPNARCINTLGGFVCECELGYEGDGRECQDIDECELKLDNCSDDAICTNTDGGFVCDCAAGFAGDGITCLDIDECFDASQDCHPNARCLNRDGSFQCECLPGWTENGRECVDVNECAQENAPCDVNALCMNTDGGFDCECKEGYSGDGLSCADVDECQEGIDDCDVNAACLNTQGGHTCVCLEGWRGDGRVCEDLDECETGVHACRPEAQCINRVGAYQCSCAEGLVELNHGCVDIDECWNGADDCHLNARCINTFGGYECACEPGFHGDGRMCVDVDECVSGLDNCHVFAQCLNRSGGFDCVCNDGFQGDGIECSDINECEVAGVDCGDHASCSNLPGRFECVCDDGYELQDEVCVNIDECTSGVSPCHPDALCFDQPGSYACECRNGFEGDGRMCTDIDECSLGISECADGLPCLNTPGGYSCGSSEVFVCDCGEGSRETCIPGDDSNDGLTPQTPQRTFDVALSSDRLMGLSPGTTIRLCEGGAFNGNIHLNQFLRCAQDTPCRLTTYAVDGGESQRPMIHGGLIVEGLDGTGAPNGLEVSALHFVGPGNGAQVGILITDDARSITLRNLEITGWAVGVDIGGDTECQIGEDCRGQVADVVLAELQLHDNRQNAIRGYGQRLTLENSQLDANGADGLNAHQVLMACRENCQQIRIIGNTFSRSSLNNAQECTRSPIQIQGRVDGLLIEANTINEGDGEARSACYGIHYLNAYGGVEHLRNLVVRANLITQVGSAAIHLTSCENCILENNIIIQNKPGSFRGIYLPDRGGAEDGRTENVTLRNNSIYVGPQATSFVFGLQLEGQADAGYVIVSNLMALMTDSAQTCCLEQTFRGNPQGPYAVMDYNLCTSLESNLRFNWARAYPSLESWSATTGLDTHSIQGAPQVISLRADMVDLRPANAQSVVVGAGHPALSAAQDYTGQPRSEPRDIGAYEFWPE